MQDDKETQNNPANKYVIANLLKKRSGMLLMPISKIDGTSSARKLGPNVISPNRYPYEFLDNTDDQIVFCGQIELINPYCRQYQRVLDVWNVVWYFWRCCYTRDERALNLLYPRQASDCVVMVLKRGCLLKSNGILVQTHAKLNKKTLITKTLITNS